MSQSSSCANSYKLSCELGGHSGEVRSLAIFKDGSIVSTSSDKTARFWRAKDGSYNECTVMKGHSDSICSACVIEPTQKNPTGFIITGSNDKNICIYYPGHEEPVHHVNAHENTVCGLSASFLEKNSFFSCSSDHTGKLWDMYDLTKPEATFSGHDPAATVWCIADLLNGSVVTGGSDNAVVIYLRSGTILHKLSRHTGCIRDIATVSHNEFLTCGNDAVTKHWHAISGACLGTYSGHVSHIYSITTVLGGSLAASCGEDRTIRVWRNGHVDQIIGVPAETIWCVRLLPNEDLVCGSSDGFIRIFSARPESYVDKKTMQNYEKSVLKYLKDFRKKHKHGGYDDIPLSIELNQPGEKDGDTIIVKQTDGVKAYKWSQEIFQWTLVGDVMESETKSCERPTFEGTQYDYVFSIDVEDGAPLLKLPYNKGQDPFEVAREFTKRHKISERRVEQIAEFVKMNLQISPILNAEALSVNPFPGGSCYVSNSASECEARASTSSRSSPSPMGQTNYIPQIYYLKLEQGNISAIHEKLKEFNAKDEDGIQSIPADKLESLIKLTIAENSVVTEEEMSNLKSLLNWPDHVVFPVLDIARLAVLKKTVNEQFCTNGILNILKRYIKKESKVSNQMLTFRLLANLFCHEAGEQFCLQCRDEVLTAIYDFTEFGSKNNEVAVSTYILNLVIALNKSNDTLGKIQVLSVIFRLLEILKEREAVFRILIGLGTLITNASNVSERSGFINSLKQSKPVLKALRILLDNVENSNTPDKLLSLTRQIIELIKQ